MKLNTSHPSASDQFLPVITGGYIGLFAALRDWQQPADSVEKVAPLTGLRQNLFIGRRGITQHDGTVIEWAGATVLLVQP
jgi:hypothetical protein